MCVRGEGGALLLCWPFANLGVLTNNLSVVSATDRALAREQRLRDKLRTTESVLNDMVRREGPLATAGAAGGLEGGSLDEFAPFRLGDAWGATLPTVATAVDGPAGAGAGAEAWQAALRTGIQAVDHWSRRVSLMVKRDARLRVYGFLYLAALHTYLLYSLLRLVV